MSELWSCIVWFHSLGLLSLNKFPGILYGICTKTILFTHGKKTIIVFGKLIEAIVIGCLFIGYNWVCPRYGIYSFPHKH